MKLFIKFKAEIRDHAATILGVLMAIMNAWINIEWSTFDIEKEWPKLLLSAGLGIGGYLMQFKIFKSKEDVSVDKR